MIGTKRYLQPPDMLLNAIHDLAGLQKARTLMSDSPRGIVRLLVSVYEAELEYRFTVKDAGGRRSDVAIEINCGEPGMQRLIDHEFALLDYVLIDRARFDLADIEAFERELRNS
jgi:hypothetical protein